MKRTMVLAGIVLVLGLAFVGCPGNDNEPPLTGTVSITGTPQVGQTLTVDTAGLGGSGGISFLWQRNDGLGWFDLAGATGGLYVVQSSDLNRYIRVSVTRAGSSGSVESTAVLIIDAPTLTGTVSITGVAQVGRTLMANTGSLGGSGEISFQWQRTNVGGSTWFDISGATDDTYVVQSGDLGRNIRVSVTRFNNSGSVTSESRTIIDMPPLDDVVRIQGGTFQMGSCSIQNVTPIRSVTLSGFYMRRFQVTQGEWYDVMGTRPSWFTGATDWNFNPVIGVNWRNLPVERVSWYDAIVFSNRLSIARDLTPAYSINGSTNPDDWGPVPTSWPWPDGNPVWDAVLVVPGSTGYRLPTEAQWECVDRSRKTAIMTTKCPVSKPGISS